MSHHAMNPVYVASLTSAKQQQAHVAQARQQLRSAQQAAAQYKGALFRTSLAMHKPGGMARAMLAKLKPRPKGLRLSKGGEHALDSESWESAGDGDGDGKAARRRVESEEEGEGRCMVESVDEDGDSREGSSESDDDEDPPERGDGDTPVRPRSGRLRRIGRVGAIASGGRGAGGRRIRVVAALHAQWAETAIDQGGLVELRRELVDRLLRAARGSDETAWRRDWMGTIAAAYAACYKLAGRTIFVEAQTLPSVRELFIERSKAISSMHLPPHRARETMFCLLWPVVHGLACPRTPTQVLAMLVRMAALVRVSDGPRPAGSGLRLPRGIAT